MEFGNCGPAWRTELRGRCSPSWVVRLSYSTVFSRKRERPQLTNLTWLENENANTSNTMNKNKHRGSTLREMLREDGVLEATEVRAVKRALALQIVRLAAEQSLSKTQMAERMNTSRAAVDRLLDASNPSITLTTLGKAARALGRRIKIELVPA